MKSKIIYIFSLFIFLLTACSGDDAIGIQNSDTGTGGSYARFLIVDDFMYVVDDTSLKTFSLSNPAEPVQVDNQPLGERIETIFRFANRLFIGSGFGLFIYEIGVDGIPNELSATNYFNTFNEFSCDPVVADSNYAFVTLNSLSRIDQPCGSPEFEITNELRVYDIVELTTPELIAVYPMSAPKGVGLDGRTLFVCDNEEGLKIYNVEDPLNIQMIKQFDTFTAFDVIPLDGLLLVVGPDNFYQFDYTDLNDIRLLSTIPYGA